MARMTLAATLGASYGVYGPAFELMERVPLAHGSEEYLNSEKYEIRHWDFNRLEDNLSGLIARLNTVRKANRALHRNASLVFHETDNPEIVAYSKRDSEGSNTVLTVVNLDPHYNQSGWVTLDLAAIGADSGSPIPSRGPDERRVAYLGRRAELCGAGPAQVPRQRLPSASPTPYRMRRVKLPIDSGRNH